MSLRPGSKNNGIVGSEEFLSDWNAFKDSLRYHNTTDIFGKNITTKTIENFEKNFVIPISQVNSHPINARYAYTEDEHAIRGNEVFYIGPNDLLDFRTFNVLQYLSPAFSGNFFKPNRGKWRAAHCNCGEEYKILVPEESNNFINALIGSSPNSELAQSRMPKEIKANIENIYYRQSYSWNAPPVKNWKLVKRNLRYFANLHIKNNFPIMKMYKHDGIDHIFQYKRMFSQDENEAVFYTLLELFFAPGRSINNGAVRMEAFSNEKLVTELIRTGIVMAEAGLKPTIEEAITLLDTGIDVDVYLGYQQPLATIA